MKKLFVTFVAMFAVCSVFAQDVTALYNDAAAAYGKKDFATAAANFEKVIDLGMDDDEAANVVATAKSTLPKCYFMLGGAAVRTSDYDTALAQFSKSAELSELYGDMTQLAKANGWIGKIYHIKGGDAFNDQDYATAAEIFAKGYAADPRNNDMALNLAMSYCESGNYAMGMEIYEDLASKPVAKYEDVVNKANEMMSLYTNNEVARLQGEGDFEGIITMADAMLEKNPESALAENVRLQAYASMENYDKVIELGEKAAEMQTNEEDKSLMYYSLGAAYNAKEMREKAIAAFQMVTAGPAVENAQAAFIELQKQK